MALSDDEAITLATLHGASFFLNNGVWWVDVGDPKPGQDMLHPIESMNYGGFSSRAAIAHTYCAYYGLDVTAEGADGGVR